MSRTQGRLDSDTGYADGQFFISALDMTATSGTVTATRNAAGDFSLNIGNSQTCVLAACLSTLIFRYGVQDWLQEQFGSGIAGGAQGLVVGGYSTLTTSSASAGSSVNVAVLNSANFTVGRMVVAGTQNTKIVAIPDSTHITLQTLTATLASGSYIKENLFTTPAGITGAPPYTAGSSAPPGNLTPVTSPRPKGLQIRQITPVYLVAGAALTTNTIGLTKTAFVNNTANAVTNILSNAANGLQTATQANPYATPIQIPTPAYQTTKGASYNIEWDVTTAGGGTARIYGVSVDVVFNYN